MKTNIALITLALSSVASPALAQDKAVHGTIIAGVGTVPEYEGADKQRIIPLAGGRLMLGSRYIALEGLTMRANILDSEMFEFGPVANLTLKRDAKIKSARIARLGIIDDAYEVGAFAAASLPVTDNDHIRLAVQGVHDVSKVHKGWLGTATASYIAPIGDKVRIIADVSATYASTDYARRYYTVTAAGASASGLTTFTAKSGIKDIGAALTGSYAVSPRWSVIGFARYKRLVGSTAESPVVAREGNRNQLSGGIGIGLSF